jgi:hypothetical protein
VSQSDPHTNQHPDSDQYADEHPNQYAHQHADEHIDADQHPNSHFMYPERRAVQPQQSGSVLQPHLHQLPPPRTADLRVSPGAMLPRRPAVRALKSA